LKPLLCLSKHTWSPRYIINTSQTTFILLHIWLFQNWHSDNNLCIRLILRITHQTFYFLDTFLSILNGNQWAFVGLYLYIKITICTLLKLIHLSLSKTHKTFNRWYSTIRRSHFRRSDIFRRKRYWKYFSI